MIRAETALPSTLTVCGDSGEELVMLKVALKSPAAVGEKSTGTKQPWPVLKVWPLQVSAPRLKGPVGVGLALGEGLTEALGLAEGVGLGLGAGGGLRPKGVAPKVTALEPSLVRVKSMAGPVTLGSELGKSMTPGFKVSLSAGILALTTTSCGVSAALSWICSVADSGVWLVGTAGTKLTLMLQLPVVGARVLPSQLLLWLKSPGLPAAAQSTVPMTKLALVAGLTTVTTCAGWPDPEPKYKAVGVTAAVGLSAATGCTNRPASNRAKGRLFNRRIAAGHTNPRQLWGHAR